MNLKLTTSQVSDLIAPLAEALNSWRSINMPTTDPADRTTMRRNYVKCLRLFWRNANAEERTIFATNIMIYCGIKNLKERTGRIYAREQVRLAGMQTTAEDVRLMKEGAL